MERGIFNKLKLGLSIFLICLFIGGNAQDLNEAITKLKDGLSIINDDPQGALNILNECISLCDEIGPDAEETKMEAESRIPTCYYKLAYQSYKDKNYEEALNGFVKTAEMADLYGDMDTKDKANNYIPKLNYAVATGKYKKGNFQDAINQYEKAIEYDPSYAKAYYGQALAYKKLNNDDKALEACDKAIEAAMNANDLKTLDKAEKLAHNILLVKGADANSKGEYNEAIELFNKAVEYNAKSSEAYFQLAFSYNKIESWDNAINAANKSLEFENGDDEKKARIYYELGTAQFGKGDSTAACDAYNNALYGAYTESAKYQIEVILKCE